MDEKWLPVVITAAIQGGALIYVIGVVRTQVQEIKRWKEDEADPAIEDHESRIVAVETTLKFDRTNTPPPRVQ